MMLQIEMLLSQVRDLRILLLVVDAWEAKRIAKQDCPPGSGVIDSGTSTTDNEEVESPGSVRYVRVYGYSGATAPYRLVIEDD